MSPSIFSLPCSGCAIAQMSLYIGGGTGSTNLFQELAGARSANCQPIRLAFEFVGDHFDLAVADLNVEILVVDADDEIGGEEPADHLQNPIFVDPSSPN